ncbi:hypothetical protein PV371_12625 [Streptomyces sp. TX20-6-3]|uniref:hypothetical protein n=1 Tax=Streptomyces sp. TX20-6-3 TaxID=3028705 RepID=UPI0029B452A4|nr:hypothetical protein [Streptomyces sp. TX20-6-3]MDX2560487.1 hypothetical protein [Streptomyces sp. TX20-6-3]
MSTPMLNGGYELSIGDWIQLDVDVPDCCDNEMATQPRATNYDQQKFNCGDCKTVVVVDSNGLIYDIR